jgi:hypothetical protein
MVLQPPPELQFFDPHQNIPPPEYQDTTNAPGTTSYIPQTPSDVVESLSTEALLYSPDSSMQESWRGQCQQMSMAPPFEEPCIPPSSPFFSDEIIPTHSLRNNSLVSNQSTYT